MNASKVLELLEKYDFNTLKELCYAEIAVETAQKLDNYKPTNKSRITALQSCLGKNSTNKAFDYAHIEGIYQVFCNGFVAVAITDHVLEFPKAPDNVQPLTIFDKAIKEAKNNNKLFVSKTDIKFIVNNQLVKNKLAKKADKNNSPDPAIIETENKKYGFNPVYMDNVIKALGGYDAVLIALNENNPLYPILVESENGVGVVLPIKLKQEIQ
jgi:hypothetical protein